MVRGVEEWQEGWGGEVVRGVGLGKTCTPPAPPPSHTHKYPILLTLYKELRTCCSSHLSVVTRRKWSARTDHLWPDIWSSRADH